MRKQLLIGLVTIVLSACSGVSAAALGLPKIDRRPAAARWSRRHRLLTSIPQYDPNSNKPFQVDLRGRLCLLAGFRRDPEPGRFSGLPGAEPYADNHMLGVWQTPGPGPDRLRPLWQAPTSPRARQARPGLRCLGVHGKLTETRSKHTRQLFFLEPEITPERFWTLALKTGHIIESQHEGKAHEFGPGLNPAALIEAHRRGHPYYKDGAKDKRPITASDGAGIAGRATRCSPS